MIMLNLVDETFLLGAKVRLITAAVITTPETVPLPMAEINLQTSAPPKILTFLKLVSKKARKTNDM